MIERLKYRKWKNIIKKSGLFDNKYYLFTYPDVYKNNIDPIVHYIKFGAKEKRNPNKDFNTEFYLDAYSDVKESNINPLVHYILSGKEEGRLQNYININNKIINNRKNILFVGHDGQVAGAQKLLLDTIIWFNENTKYNINILLLDNGILVKEYKKYGNVFVTCKNANKYDSLNHFLDEEFEFIYLSTVVSGNFFKILQQYELELNTKYIASIHEMRETIEMFKEQFFMMKPFINFWISGSQKVTEDLINYYNISKETITTIPAFIKPSIKNREDISSARNKARKYFNIKNNTFVVVGCGTTYYRKGPDIFIQTARKLKLITDENFIFIWIGDGPTQKELKESLNKDEEKYIRLVGFENNVQELMAVGDLFFLSSREDPFPLVVLLAAQYFIPSLCFSEATGITEFIKDDAGISMNKIDFSLAAEEIKKLMLNNNILINLGKNAFERLFNEYTVEKKMLQIYNLIQEKIVKIGFLKSLSVIIPCYNHALFIEERIKSILEQDIKDIEILILDDASDDNTVEVIQPFLSDSRISLYVNDVNSGSPFKQWKKGIDLAKGEIIWIAEGDDSCSNNFLSILLPYFNNPFINLAFSKIEMMDENSKINKCAFDNYLNNAYSGKFLQSYIKNGNDEINEQLGATNTLLNASGILIRKSSFGKTLEMSEKFKMCGDWLIYIECIKNGKIAYDTRAINYFRRHSASQVAKIEGNAQYFREREEISKYVFSNFNITEELKDKTFVIIDQEWERFKYKHTDKQLNDFYNKESLLKQINNKKNEELRSLAIIVSDLSPGGGQLFGIRLANAWKKIGGNVVLLNVDKHPKNNEVIKKIDKNVPCFDINNIDFEDIINIYGIDVIHSSIWWADKYVFENIGKISHKVKWIITMHGCYESLLENSDWDGKFLEYFPKMLDYVDEWVYTAEKNKKIFERYTYPKKLSKILNGYEVEIPLKIERSSLGIDKDSFILCLASRAIESKGWYIAVEALEKLNNKGLKVDLLLIGEGEAAIDLKNKNKNNKNIHFFGQVSNLADFISLSDIGILPTTFIGESMPLVLIEFMAQGKPIISTNIGEIKLMIKDELGSAGFILEIDNHKINVNLLIDAVVNLYNDKNKVIEFSKHSNRLFDKFKMNNMINEYAKIYK